jgi:hypothetical protein
MKNSFHTIGSLGAGLMLLVAASLPQNSLAQRFSHGGGGGGGRSAPPAGRPAPAMNCPAPAMNRPAPMENRSAPAVNRPAENRPAPVQNRPVENRPAPVQEVRPAPAGAINGGSRNAGSHDFSRAGTTPEPPRTVNARANGRENVNVYHSNPRITYRPYANHPYHPYSWGASWHPVGFFLASLAADAYLFSQAGQNYYYDDGVYYAPASGGYDVVAAPIGATVSSLPPGYETVMVGDDYYYYYGGTFYINTGQNYQVVDAPPGAVVSEVPDGATEQDVNGETYLVYNNTYYEPVSSDGQDAYQVVQMNQ